MSVSDEAFVSLARVLRAGGEEPCAAPPPEALPEIAVMPPVAAPEADDVAGEVRVFRARLADAFDGARDALLRELACAILGRELVLAPADIAVIVTRLLADHPGAHPLRLRVAPEDVARLDAVRDTLPPIVADAELASGDAIVECADGPLDARMGVRLAALLERA